MHAGHYSEPNNEDIIQTALYVHMRPLMNIWATNTCMDILAVTLVLEQFKLVNSLQFVKFTKLNSLQTFLDLQS